MSAEVTGSQQVLRRHRRTAGEVLRFVVVGAVNTAVYYGLYLALLVVLPYLPAHLLAWTLAMLGSFFLNCYFTYRTRPTWRRFFLFPLSTLLNVVLTTVGVYGLVEWVHVATWLAPLLVTAVAVPVTFIVARTILTSGEPSSS